MMRLARRRDLDATAVGQMAAYTAPAYSMHERSCAIQALGDSQHEAAAAPLLLLLDDASPHIAESALRALDFSDSPEVRAALLELARKAPRGLRSVALEVLARRRDPEAVSLLAVALEESMESHVRQHYVMLLGMARDPRALPLLHKYVSEGPRMLQEAALSALGEIGGRAAVQTLIDIIHDRPELAQSAVYALSRSDSEEGRELLLEIARGDEGYGEHVVTAALAALTNHKQPEVRALMLGLLSGEAWGRVGIALQYVGEQRVEEAVPTLLKLMREAAPSQLWQVAHALSQIGGERARAGLEALARSPGQLGQVAMQHLLQVPGGADTVRSIALEKVRETRGEAAGTWLEMLAQDESHEARDALFRAARGADAALSQRALQLLGSRADSESLELLMDVAQRSQDPALRSAAFGALAARDDPSVLALVRQGVKDPDLNVRTASIHALVRHGGQASEAALIEASRDAHPEVQAASASALMQLATPRALQRLEELARSGTSQEVAQQALMALQEVAPSRSAALAQSLAASGTREGALAAVWSLQFASKSSAERILRSIAKAADPEVLREAFAYAGGIGLPPSHLEGMLGQLAANGDVPDEVRAIARQSGLEAGRFEQRRLRSH